MSINLPQPWGEDEPPGRREYEQKFWGNGLAKHWDDLDPTDQTYWTERATRERRRGTYTPPRPQAQTLRNAAKELRAARADGSWMRIEDATEALLLAVDAAIKEVPK